MTPPTVGILLAMTAALALLVGPSLAPSAPHLIYNATPSAPLGLYVVRPVDRFRPSQPVLAMLPPASAQLAHARGYVPAGVPVLKRIAALSGDTVCRAGERVTIGGQFAARALARDRAGRALPVWSGCHTLTAGEIFLLSGDHPAAFDGRYFGPTPTALVIGEARALWTR